MSDILRVHEEMNFFVHGDDHRGGHDVVARIRIMFRVEPKEILRSFINELGVKGAEFSIRAGIAEIESELSGLDLDRHGIGRRRGEIYVSPRLHAKDSQRHDFDAYYQQCGNHQTLGTAGKILDLGIGGTVGELPDKNRQNELCGEKGDSRFRHSLRHLLIDQTTMSRYVLWRRPSVAQDGYCGKDRDYDDGDRKEFCHDAPPSGCCLRFLTTWESAAENGTPPRTFR